MKCENREEKISLYIDRQLDWQEQKEFLKHIKQCPECKQALQQAQQLRQMLLDMPQEEVPEGLHENIMKAIQKEMQKEAQKTSKKASNKTIIKRKKVWHQYGVLAASFLILAAGVSLYKKNNSINMDNTAMQLSGDILVGEGAILADMDELGEVGEVGEVEEIEEQNNEPFQQQPNITQSRTVKNPETSKALPQTPYIASSEPETQKTEGAETTQSEGAEEAIQGEQNDQNSEQKQETQKVLTQSASETKNDIESDIADDLQDNGEIKSEHQKSTNNMRAVPSNMKSKSLQITLKANNADKILKNIEKRVKALGGEVETADAQNSITVKVPLSEYNNVSNWIEQQGEVIDKQEFTEDLAKQYKEIQKQQYDASEKEKEAEQKQQPRKAQEARKIQKECQNALDELKKTAEFATITAIFSE